MEKEKHNDLQLNERILTEIKEEKKEPKYVELTGHASIDSKEILGEFGGVQEPSKSKSEEVTLGSVLQMMLGGMLLNQLMNQPINEELLKQLFTPPTDKNDKKN